MSSERKSTGNSMQTTVLACSSRISGVKNVEFSRRFLSGYLISITVLPVSVLSVTQSNPMIVVAVFVDLRAHIQVAILWFCDTMFIFLYCVY